MARYTLKQGIGEVLRRARLTLARDPNRFLRQCKAVIHVGANQGHERELYARHSLSVLWVEASPEMFQTLSGNLRGFPKQKAVNALVTDKEGGTYDFHVSNNDGLSSSIYELGDHKEIWPEVDYARTIQLRSTTLRALVLEAGYALSAFDALVLDIQGAELLAIQGAGEILDSLRFIKAEASDFQAYQGACTVDTLSDALKERGFIVRRKERFAGKEGIGSYYDVLYERSAG